MIKNFFLTGDTHGNNDKRVWSILHNNSVNPQETAVIILGDAGFNYYLNKRDYWNKKKTSELGCHVYCVRGNHEQRPELISTMSKTYDKDVQGYVYFEPEFPLIKYFIDGEIYTINGYKVLIIGGAYSVDKHYRMQIDAQWFPNEQLTEQEMNEIEYNINGNTVDLVLSHTCPISFQPTDLFLTCINQNLVDNTMEKWLEKIKDSFNWTVWCFGHYHDDRIQKPYVEMFYTGYQNLNDLMNYWKNYGIIEEAEWQLGEMKNG